MRFQAEAIDDDSHLYSSPMQQSGSRATRRSLKRWRTGMARKPERTVRKANLMVGIQQFYTEICLASMNNSEPKFNNHLQVKNNNIEPKNQNHRRQKGTTNNTVVYGQCCQETGPNRRCKLSLFLSEVVSQISS